MHYTDNTANPLSDGTGGIASLRLLRPLRPPSVVELTRCLHDLQVFAPLEHAHLKAFYCSEWRIAHAGRKQDVPPRQREKAVYDIKRKTYAYRARVIPAWVQTHRK